MSRKNDKASDASRLLQPGYLSGKQWQTNLASKLSAAATNRTGEEKVFSRKKVTLTNKKVETKRAAFTNVTNSPKVKNHSSDEVVVRSTNKSPSAISKSKVVVSQQKKDYGDKTFSQSSKNLKTRNLMVEKTRNNNFQEDIEFEADENALACILNEEGVTQKMLAKMRVNGQNTDGRPSQVINNQRVFPDGRPSGCMRVPNNRNNVISKSTTGPRRVKKSNNANNGRSVSLYEKPRSSSSLLNSRTSQSHTRTSLMRKNMTASTNSNKRVSSYDTTAATKNSFDFNVPTQSSFHQPSTSVFHNKKVRTATTSKPKQIMSKKKSVVKFADEITATSSSKNSKPKSILKKKLSSNQHHLHLDKVSDENEYEVVEPQTINQVEEICEVQDDESPPSSPVIKVDRVVSELKKQMMSSKRRSMQAEYETVLKLLESANKKKENGNVDRLQTIAEESPLPLVVHQTPLTNETPSPPSVLFKEPLVQRTPSLPSTNQQTLAVEKSPLFLSPQPISKLIAEEKRDENEVDEADSVSCKLDDHDKVITEKIENLKLEVALTESTRKQRTLSRRDEWLSPLRTTDLYQCSRSAKQASVSRDERAASLTTNYSSLRKLPHNPSNYFSLSQARRFTPIQEENKMNELIESASPTLSRIRPSTFTSNEVTAAAPSTNCPVLFRTELKSDDKCEVEEKATSSFTQPPPPSSMKKHQPQVFTPIKDMFRPLPLRKEQQQQLPAAATWSEELAKYKTPTKITTVLATTTTPRPQAEVTRHVTNGQIAQSAYEPSPSLSSSLRYRNLMVETPLVLRRYRECLMQMRHQPYKRSPVTTHYRKINESCTDDEVAGFTTNKKEADVNEDLCGVDPVARLLYVGDDQHFVPLSCNNTPKGSAKEGELSFEK